MPIINGDKKYIHEESFKNDQVVSEDALTRVAGSLNFLNNERSECITMQWSGSEYREFLVGGGSIPNRWLYDSNVHLIKNECRLKFFAFSCHSFTGELQLFNYAQQLGYTVNNQAIFRQGFFTPIQYNLPIYYAPSSSVDTEQGYSIAGSSFTHAYSEASYFALELFDEASSGTLAIERIANNNIFNSGDTLTFIPYVESSTFNTLRIDLILEYL